MRPKSFLRLVIVTVLCLALSCVGVQIKRPADILHNRSSAVVLLSYGAYTCSAFHIGNGIFVSAAHCVSNEGDLNQIFLHSANGQFYHGMLIEADVAHDLLLLKVVDFAGPKLELWDESSLSTGTELMAMGFPGYFDTKFTFEVGYFLGSVTYRGRKFLMAKDLSSLGYSGGPIIELVSGKVVGVQSMLGNSKIAMGEDAQDNWLAIATWVGDLRQLLEKNHLN